MNIAIIDDDLIFLDKFENYLKIYLPKYFNNFTIDSINNDFYQKLTSKKYDVIFIDIDLQSITGINLIFSLKKIISSLVIFVSSRNDMVFNALSVQPFHFIRKNSLLEDLHLTLVLLNNYFKDKNLLLVLEFFGRKTEIKINDIVYLQSDKHEITIVTTNDSYIYRSTMKNILKEINNKTFIQIQKSIAINLDFIKEIDDNFDLVLRNGNIFTINRFYKKNFKEKYKEYLLL